MNVVEIFFPQPGGRAVTKWRHRLTMVQNSAVAFGGENEQVSRIFKEADILNDQ